MNGDESEADFCMHEFKKARKDETENRTFKAVFKRNFIRIWNSDK